MSGFQSGVLWDGLITSVSGWRKIFSPVRGITYSDAHGAEPRIAVEHADLLLVHYAVFAYLDTMRAQWTPPKSRAVIAVGRDTRASGFELSRAALEACAQYVAASGASRDEGLAVATVDLGIISSPHIMSYAQARADGFIYITASHNPPQYNGIKFGDGAGCVLAKPQAQALADRFFSVYAPLAKKRLSSVSSDRGAQALRAALLGGHAGAASKKTTSRAAAAPPNVSTSASSVTLSGTLSGRAEKLRANRAYAQSVCRAVFRGLASDTHAVRALVRKKMAKSLRENKNAWGFLWDANGGARATSFDKQFFRALGVPFRRMNTALGSFAHDIVPEGDALFGARRMLSRLNLHFSARPNARGAKIPRPSYVAAFVSDCDGDRGNIVLQNPPKKIKQKNIKTAAAREADALEDTRVLQAQEVFALVLEIELAWQRLVDPRGKIALVINDASSVRCELAAARYGCDVFRVEVGEANVVSRAADLRAQGYAVPLVGEASNGGIIMHPSTVRDPLCTALSCLKAVLWKDELSAVMKMGAVSREAARGDKESSKERAAESAAEIMQRVAVSLPLAATTEVEDELAKFSLPPRAPLAKSMEAVASAALSQRDVFARLFARHGVRVTKTMLRNFTGTLMREDEKYFDITQGGVGLYFFTSAAKSTKSVPCGFVWMRPSGTEPVVRVVADAAAGNQSAALERELIRAWRDVLDAALRPLR